MLESTVTILCRKINNDAAICVSATSNIARKHHYYVSIIQTDAVSAQRRSRQKNLAYQVIKLI